MSAPETPSAALARRYNAHVDLAARLAAQFADLERKHEALVEAAERALRIVESSHCCTWESDARALLRRALGAGK